MVLSVCGVTCDLIDGQLHIHGTSADDSIAVRYDAATDHIQVVGGIDEVVGQFPLASVESLNFNGLAASDAFHVDSSLSLPIGFNGEGEDRQPASSQQSAHQHGAPTTISSAITTSAPALPDSRDQTISRSRSDESNETVSLISLSPAATTSNIQIPLPQPASHDSHLSFAATTPILSAHSNHAESTGFSPLANPLSSIPQAHDHGAAYFTSTAAELPAISPFVNHNPSSITIVETTIGSADHDRHPGIKATVETSSKLVPKRCTVTVSGGVLITSVDGKRQCDCDAKAQAAQEVKQQLAAEGRPAPILLLTSRLDCQPCQRSSLSGIAAEFAICNFAPTGADQGSPSPIPLLMLDHLHGESCPEKPSYASDQQQAADAEFLRGLQIVGLSMLAASVALLPTLRAPRDERRNEDDFQPAVDWLFGRFHVEPLLAR